MDEFKKEDKLNEFNAALKEKTEQVKDSASELYEEGKQKIHDIEGCIEEYSAEILQKVKENPLTSVLIAGGIGYIFAKLLKK